MTASPIAREARSDSRTATLNLIDRLVRELGDDGVRYCHWKSNLHLDLALAGTDDLDILVSAEDKPRAEAIFANLGFQHFIQIPTKRFNGIADLIGFDEDSGRLVHLHTHYRLTLGQQRLKGYRLPWEDTVLETIRPAHNETPILLPSAESQLLLLVIRTCLKVTLRDRMIPGRFKRKLSKDFEPDRAWLQPQIDEQDLQDLSAEWLGPGVWPQVRTVALSPSDDAGIFKLRKMTAKLLSQYRIYGPCESLIRTRVREAAWAFGVVNKRYLHWPRPWGRAATSSGIIVCVLGADGAGKSTLTKELVRWLNFKLDAIPLYMGSGDGTSSLPLKALKLVRRLLLKNRDGQTRRASPEPNKKIRDKSSDSFALKLARLVWGVVLALEKKSKLKLAFRASNRGMIVIADRYAQVQTLGFNDGPLLQDFQDSRSGLFRAIARWELETYRISERISPDVVIKLMVPVETAIARKPEMSRAEIERRNEAVEKMSFPERTRVVAIPADLPIEEVFLRAKAAVWPSI